MAVNEEPELEEGREHEHVDEEINDQGYDEAPEDGDGFEAAVGGRPPIENEEVPLEVEGLLERTDAELASVLKPLLRQRLGALRELVDWAVPDLVYGGSRSLTERRGRGIVKSFSLATGYGFVTSPGLAQEFGKDIYVSSHQIGSCEVGEEVSFAILMHRGRPQAFDLVPIGVDRRRHLDGKGLGEKGASHGKGGGESEGPPRRLWGSDRLPEPPVMGGKGQPPAWGSDHVPGDAWAWGSPPPGSCGKGWSDGFDTGPVWGKGKCDGGKAWGKRDEYGPRDDFGREEDFSDGRGKGWCGKGWNAADPFPNGKGWPDEGKGWGKDKDVGEKGSWDGLAPPPRPPQWLSTTGPPPDRRRPASDGGSGHEADARDVGRGENFTIRGSKVEIDGVTDRRFVGNLKSCGKDYGFILCHDLLEYFGKEEIYVHANHLIGYSIGDAISFEVIVNEQRKPQAVQLESGSSTPAPPRKRTRFDEPPPAPAAPAPPAAPPPPGGSSGGKSNVAMPGITDRRWEGVVKSKGKQYGFVICGEIASTFNNEDVYVHQTHLQGLNIGDEVTFSVLVNSQGRPQAVDLELR
eukprot:TRINITY_DN20185_c0_g1_i1.p1 TRINITY_DN20185_c0_g1~~TRINITY_DN20185_c0_g1_i1.p1  ORF type:complete len:608 (-),score=122.43 TRINITY_DN20185_c0_g1_i1:145-1872(-)